MTKANTKEEDKSFDKELEERKLPTGKSVTLRSCSSAISEGTPAPLLLSVGHSLGTGLLCPTEPCFLFPTNSSMVNSILFVFANVL